MMTTSFTTRLTTRLIEPSLVNEKTRGLETPLESMTYIHTYHCPSTSIFCILRHPSSHGFFVHTKAPKGFLIRLPEDAAYGSVSCRFSPAD